ncbi:MAG: threonine--tRNA ligase [Myxococcota bacterium]|jgi:threonyl-tRNA synthetase|nr:threonine--tRNA ligase [Myxococcota bacterium]HHW97194.1 threonine--tRNA ligase [Oligoflexales bacterium]HQC45615.1 threonine--tRNA ligase [Myxococcota bacterium]HQL58244.1 threonine--tRNA ligase [Myxococcota bacterium]
MSQVSVEINNQRFDVQSDSSWAQVIADHLGNSLDTSSILAVEVGDHRYDLMATVIPNASAKTLTFADEGGLDTFRHSSAHLMAQAVLRLFPDAKPTIGPVVEEGFYYDFGAQPFTPEDLQRIEAEMAKIVAENLPIRRIELPKEQALAQFADNPFKVEMIQELEEGTISAYQQGDFIDLCRGPHVPSTSFIKAFKLTKVAGAYWRGDINRPQLQRIYGISFPTAEELDDYLAKLQAAKERDHRRLGQEMDLFSFHEEGTGFPFWHAKGMVLKNTVVDYWRQVHHKYGYTEIQTPQILNQVLWQMSGHWDHYQKNMYFTNIDDTPHAVKPMNCPGGLLVYKAKMHSYREFPLRVAELGLVHRHELSGVLHGLFRVRAFTQDDAHIFCTPEQVKDEVVNVIRQVFEIYETFGFSDVHVELSTRPEKSIGSDEIWQIAEAGLQNALESQDISYQLNPGDGAFYGPKIDFHIRDCMGRSWQCGTIQVDFSMPERFKATYEAADGTRKTPVMIHRAILGSLERFIGILIEHYGGKFPLWLNPNQVKVVPVSDKFLDWAQTVTDALAKAGIRADLDSRKENLGRKIRDAQLQQYGYQLVIGGREAESGSVSVRLRSGEDLGAMPLDEFVNRVVTEVANRTL